MEEQDKQNKTDKTTYLCLANDEGMSFEVDLVTFREKGHQTKYLAINFIDTKQAEPVVVSAMSFDENAFIKIKDFFKQLDWKE
jgi:hypothetical protein